MLNIKNPETHRLAKELAKRRGESLTGVVTYALREQLAREPVLVKKKATMAEIEATLDIIRKAAPPAFFDAEDPTAEFYDPRDGPSRLIVDTSALVAVVKKEPEGPAFQTLMLSSAVRISAVTFFEFGMVVDSWRDEAASRAVDVFLSQIEAEVIVVDAETARIARAAYKRFGKKNHPAALNFGDCFAYALAKQTGESLLFKGNDFSLTDIVAV